MDNDVADVAIADWDIPGSFQIERPGTVKINFRYHLLLDADPLNASLTNGHGFAALWISEHGVNTLVREGYLGVPEISGIGDLADCAFDYVGTHAANTRFLFLHRVPPGSVLGNMDAFNAYYDEFDAGGAEQPRRAGTHHKVDELMTPEANWPVFQGARAALRASGWRRLWCTNGRVCRC